MCKYFHAMLYVCLTPTVRNHLTNASWDDVDSNCTFKYSYNSPNDSSLWAINLLVSCLNPITNCCIPLFLCTLLFHSCITLCMFHIVKDDNNDIKGACVSEKPFHSHYIVHGPVCIVCFICKILAI